MNNHKLIQSINELLDRPWTEKDMMIGRQIKVPCTWGSEIVFQTAKQYKASGWNVGQAVKTSLGLRYYYLRFRNPNNSIEFLQGKS